MRSPLLLITAICVGLGAWVVPAERHRRAVAAVEVLGGRLVYGEDGKSANVVWFFVTGACRFAAKVEPVEL